MASIKVNAGILTDIQHDYFRDEIEKMMCSQNNFTLLTVRRNCAARTSSEIKMLLNTWIYKNNLDLIFILGSTGSLHSLKMTKEVEREIKEMHNLATLMIGKLEGTYHRCNCCVIEKTLILEFPVLTNVLEISFENLFPILIGAVKEIRTGNTCFTVDTSETRLKEELGCKSKVKFLKTAERPRKSPYKMISVKDAVETILLETSTLGTEGRNYRDCLGLILAENVIAMDPYPPFPASIKDGYAVLADDASRIRSVIGGTTPGFQPEYNVVPGTCVRVSTGSVIPVGTNAVIQVEDTTVFEKDNEGNELKIEILKLPEVMQDIRAVGSDLSEGELLIPKYKKITAAEIGLMSMCGIQRVQLYIKPWVALLSTGDEVLEPDMPLMPGCIRDSNKSSLTYMLIENKIPVVDVGIARDNPDDVKSHLKLAMETSDVIISTGGVSMGEKDILKQVLEIDFNATIHFGRIHMKPGKPTTFSTANFEGRKKLIFSLPGNPVSAFVCFFLFVLPCIKKLMGFQEPRHSTIKVQLGHDIKLDERPEFCRVSLTCNENGIFIAHTTGSQQSSRLLSLENADALLILPPRSPQQTTLKAGSLVEAILVQPV